MQMLDVLYSNVTPYLHSPGCVQPLSRGRGMLCCNAPPPGRPPPLAPAWAASAWCPAPRTRSGAAARLSAAAGDNLDRGDCKRFLKSRSDGLISSRHVTPVTKLRFCGFTVVHFGIMFWDSYFYQIILKRKGSSSELGSENVHEELQNVTNDNSRLSAVQVRRNRILPQWWHTAPVPACHIVSLFKLRPWGDSLINFIFKPWA